MRARARRFWLRLTVAMIGLSALLMLPGTPAFAQKIYKSPQDAVDALGAAARTGTWAAFVDVLGAEGLDIASSGDAAADTATRRIFLQIFDQARRIEQTGERQATLVLGPQDWSFPIPLLQDRRGWRFDTATGRQEILYRRIGRNELDAIQAALAFVDAQDEYADMNGGEYAQRIVSAPGRRNGLYWTASVGEQPSPLGEAIAAATSEGYRISGDARTPYRGYYYKVLSRQGPTAPGGAANYVVDGRMIGGFALVAWPALYGNSGVMTFLVNHRGEVFQKDLGINTARLAEAMTAYSPDHTWRRAEPSR